DYDWPAVVDPDLDAAFTAYRSRRGAVRRARGILRGGDRWHKDGHLERMQASGCFRLCREALLHSVEHGDAARPVGFACRLGIPVADRTADELEREFRIDELDDIARRVLGERTVPFVFGYRVRMGVV